jgi:hypothetical protein
MPVSVFTKAASVCAPVTASVREALIAAIADLAHPQRLPSLLQQAHYRVAIAKEYALDI